MKRKRLGEADSRRWRWRPSREEEIILERGGAGWGSLNLMGLARGNVLEEVTGKVGESEKGPGYFDIALEMRAPQSPS